MTGVQTCALPIFPLGQRTDDAEVQRDVFAEMFRIDGNKDIARMHVGMEKTIAKYLHKKNLNPDEKQKYYEYNRSLADVKFARKRGLFVDKIYSRF